jgi:hypothetical protein
MVSHQVAARRAVTRRSEIPEQQTIAPSVISRILRVMTAGLVGSSRIWAGDVT